MRRVVLPLLLLASIVGARSSYADPGVETARRLFAEGQKHYDLGEFAEALRSFQDAYRAKEDAALLFNIGQCQYKLHEDEAALHSYRSYLRRVGDTPYRDLVDGRIHELEARLARPAPSVPPPPPPLAAPVAAVVAPPPRATEKPTPSRWWLWPVLGAVVAGGVVATVLATRDPTKVPASDLGFRRIFQ